MTRLGLITQSRHLPQWGRFLPKPLPVPAPTGTTGGVARPLLRFIDPRYRRFRGLDQPLYPSADTTAAPRFRLQVAGSATLGGETETALAVGPVKVLEASPTPEDDRLPLQLDVAPWFLGSTGYLVRVEPAVVGTATDGTRTVATATVVQALTVIGATVPQGLVATAHTVYLELGGMLAGTAYGVRLRTSDTRGRTRSIRFSIQCRA